MKSPTLKIYHANARGTGSAVSITLVPATAEAEGAIIVRAARQAALGEGGATFPRFDWASAIEARLRFGDVCEVLRVLRGECESLADGAGLFIRKEGEPALTFVRLRHIVEPVAGYSLKLFAKPSGGEERSASMFLTPSEAFGLCLALEQSFGALCFGVFMA